MVLGGGDAAALLQRGRRHLAVAAHDGIAAIHHHLALEDGAEVLPDLRNRGVGQGEEHHLAELGRLLGQSGAGLGSRLRHQRLQGVGVA